MGLKETLSGITASIEANSTDTKPAARGARTAPGQLFAFSEQAQEVQHELELLKKAAGAPRILERAKLRPSPYQTRSITTEEVGALASNLRENELATPIIVREIAPDVFEIIAGHRRDMAFGVLARDTIPAIVVKMNDEQAERAVFYDNFFPPELSDYEKYLGLMQVKQRHGYSHEELSEHSGISRTLVSYLLAFERLPEAAHQVLQEHKRLIGATLAAKLASVSPAAHARLTEGLLLLADGTLKQSQVFDWIVGKLPSKKSEPVIIRSGKAVFAKVLRRDERLTIDFADVANAASLEREITKLIKDRATAKK